MNRACALAFVLAALLAAFAGCSRPSGSVGATATGGAPSAKPAGPPTVPASPGEAAAEVDGAPITRAELDGKIEGGLARVRQEEYDLRREALDKLIAERLIDAEAARRGISREELLRQEVDAKVTAPAATQVESIYDKNRERFSGQGREQALTRIRELLRDRAKTERRAAFEQELRGRARVTTHLEPPRGKAEIPTDAPATGPAGAKVTIIEYTDYQCPFCHRAQSVMDELLSRYAGKVRLVHMDFPLEGHPGAVPAARAARCAGEQGRFWEYHHSLMTVRGALDDADLKSRATALHLDAGPFGACVASGRHDAAIQAQLEHGTEVGVTGTPAYFINGRMLVGARPFEDFAQVIDAELAATR
jgi:predicted DsbA family dithiol-disulfide isomerase